MVKVTAVKKHNSKENMYICHDNTVSSKQNVGSLLVLMENKFKFSLQAAIFSLRIKQPSIINKNTKKW